MSPTPNPIFPTERTNTILYCRSWTETVEFYREALGLEVAFANDWFVEFALGTHSYLSIADASRSSIDPAEGAGVTITWEVADLEQAHRSLAVRGLDPGEIHHRWGASVLHFFDPEGHRLELWSMP